MKLYKMPKFLMFFLIVILPSEGTQQESCVCKESYQKSVSSGLCVPVNTNCIDIVVQPVEYVDITEIPHVCVSTINDTMLPPPAVVGKSRSVIAGLLESTKWRYNSTHIIRGKWTYKYEHPSVMLHGLYPSIVNLVSDSFVFVDGRNVLHGMQQGEITIIKHLHTIIHKVYSIVVDYTMVYILEMEKSQHDSRVTLHRTATSIDGRLSLMSATDIQVLYYTGDIQVLTCADHCQVIIWGDTDNDLWIAQIQHNNTIVPHILRKNYDRTVTYTSIHSIVSTQLFYAFSNSAQVAEYTFGRQEISCSLQIHYNDTSEVCADGQTHAVGHIHNTQAHSCAHCPLDTFKNNVGDHACMACPSSTRTRIMGATKRSLCHCQQGYEWDSGARLCLPCLEGKYNDIIGGRCQQCSLDKVNTGSGNTQCYCMLGKFEDGDACNDCRQGSYKSNTTYKYCSLCPDGSTTVETGSTSESDCVCMAGFQRQKNGTNLCSACAAGTFSRQKNSICEQCESGKFANTIAATFCEECPAQTVSPARGGVTCLLCTNGKLANTQHNTCEADKEVEISAMVYTFEMLCFSVDHQELNCKSNEHFVTIEKHMYTQRFVDNTSGLVVAEIQTTYDALQDPQCSTYNTEHVNVEGRHMIQTLTVARGEVYGEWYGIQSVPDPNIYYSLCSTTHNWGMLSVKPQTCPPGAYSRRVHTQVHECTVCPAGTYKETRGTGISECILCPSKKSSPGSQFLQDCDHKACGDNEVVYSPKNRHLLGSISCLNAICSDIKDNNVNKSVVFAVCGNGLIDTNEEHCDDGNTNNDDGCSDLCTLEVGWECNSESPSLCHTLCGDGIIVGEEMCDDLNREDGDGCSKHCFLEIGYSCVSNPGDTLQISSRSKCVKDCGNGVLEDDWEECDDGNTRSGDGCSAGCRHETVVQCGDWKISTQNGEECDDGNNKNSDGCNHECAIERWWMCTNVESTSQSCVTLCSGHFFCVQKCLQSIGSFCKGKCGDGIVITHGFEYCDDGNQDNYDGCDDRCVIEPGYTCTYEQVLAYTSMTVYKNETSTVEEVITFDYPMLWEDIQDTFSFHEVITKSHYYETLFKGLGCTKICPENTEWREDVCVPLCPGCTCGDGILSPIKGEECDDGNTVPNDGCSENCRVETVCEQKHKADYTAVCPSYAFPRYESIHTVYVLEDEASENPVYHRNSTNYAYEYLMYPPMVQGYNYTSKQISSFLISKIALPEQCIPCKTNQIPGFYFEEDECRECPSGKFKEEGDFYCLPCIGNSSVKTRCDGTKYCACEDGTQNCMCSGFEIVVGGRHEWAYGMDKSILQQYLLNYDATIHDDKSLSPTFRNAPPTLTDPANYVYEMTREYVNKIYTGDYNTTNPLWELYPRCSNTQCDAAQTIKNEAGFATCVVCVPGEYFSISSRKCENCPGNSTSHENNAFVCDCLASYSPSSHYLKSHITLSAERLLEILNIWNFAPEWIRTQANSVYSVRDSDLLSCEPCAKTQYNPTGVRDNWWSLHGVEDTLCVDIPEQYVGYDYTTSQFTCSDGMSLSDHVCVVTCSEVHMYNPYTGLCCPETYFFDQDTGTCKQCNRGEYLRGIRCVACSSDTYKPNWGTSKCTTCPSGKLMNAAINTKIDSSGCVCIGDGYATSIAGTCEQCWEGSYVSWSVIPGVSTCARCPGGSSSPQGSTSIQNCSVDKCPAYVENSLHTHRQAVRIPPDNVLMCARCGTEGFFNPISGLCECTGGIVYSGINDCFNGDTDACDRVFRSDDSDSTPTVCIACTVIQDPDTGIVLHTQHPDHQKHLTSQFDCWCSESFARKSPRSRCQEITPDFCGRWHALDQNNQVCVPQGIIPDGHFFNGINIEQCPPNTYKLQHEITTLEPTTCNTCGENGGTYYLVSGQGEIPVQEARSAQTVCVCDEDYTWVANKGCVFKPKCAPGTFSETGYKTVLRIDTSSTNVLECNKCILENHYVDRTRTKCVFNNTCTQRLGFTTAYLNGVQTCVCDSGYGGDPLQQCRQCAIGYYRHLPVYTSPVGHSTINVNVYTQTLECTPCPHTTITRRTTLQRGSSFEYECVCMRNQVLRLVEGGNALLSNNSICYDCANGTYNNNFAESTCKSCGELEILQEVSNVCACRAGYYYNYHYNCSNDHTDIVLCRKPGKCTACPAGTSKVIAGDGYACTSCPANTYSLEGASTCTQCPLGLVSNNATSSTGCICDVNYGFQGGECVMCTANTQKETRGNFPCVCQKGYTPKNETSPLECVACTPGEFKNVHGNLPCTQCGAGRYSTVPASFTCSECNEHQQTVDVKNMLSEWKAQEYDHETWRDLNRWYPRVLMYRSHYIQSYVGVPIIHNSDSPSNCVCGMQHTHDPHNTFRVNYTWVSQYSAVLANPPCVPLNLCVDPNTHFALFDHEYDTNKSKCTRCPVNMENRREGDGFCEFCPTGSTKYNGPDVSNMWHTCRKCEYASFLNTSDYTCVSCDENMVPSTTGISCNPCPPNTYRPYGKTSCICFDGYTATYTKDSQLQCSPCPHGYHRNIKHNTRITGCVMCETGKTSQNISASSACKKCRNNMTSIDGICLCGVGYSYTRTDDHGEPVCEMCELGKYKSQIGNFGCTMCPDIYPLTKSKGSSECTECDARMTYIFSRRECVCNFGSEWNTQSHSCVTCPAGKYRGDMEVDVCMNCANNSVASLDMSLCVQCMPNSSPESILSHDEVITGVQECVCNSGYTHTGRVCQRCEVGKSSEASRNSTCTTCSGGTYNDHNNYTQCVPCPPGMVSSTDGTYCMCNTTHYFTVVNTHTTPYSQTCVRCPDKSKPNANSTTCICDENRIFVTSEDTPMCHLCNTTTEIPNEQLDKCVCSPTSYKNANKCMVTIAIHSQNIIGLSMAIQEGQTKVFTSEKSTYNNNIFQQQVILNTNTLYTVKLEPSTNYNWFTGINGIVAHAEIQYGVSSDTIIPKDSFDNSHTLFITSDDCLLCSECREFSSQNEENNGCDCIDNYELKDNECVPCPLFHTSVKGQECVLSACGNGSLTVPPMIPTEDLLLWYQFEQVQGATTSHHIKDTSAYLRHGKCVQGGYVNSQLTTENRECTYAHDNGTSIKLIAETTDTNYENFQMYSFIQLPPFELPQTFTVSMWIRFEAEFSNSEFSILGGKSLDYYISIFVRNSIVKLKVFRTSQFFIFEMEGPDISGWNDNNFHNLMFVISKEGESSIVADGLKNSNEVPSINTWWPENTMFQFNINIFVWEFMDSIEGNLKDFRIYRHRLSPLVMDNIFKGISTRSDLYPTVDDIHYPLSRQERILWYYDILLWYTFENHTNSNLLIDNSEYKRDATCYAHQHTHIHCDGTHGDHRNCSRYTVENSLSLEPTCTISVDIPLVVVGNAFSVSMKVLWQEPDNFINLESYIFQAETSTQDNIYFKITLTRRYSYADRSGAIFFSVERHYSDGSSQSDLDYMSIVVPDEKIVYGNWYNIVLVIASEPQIALYLDGEKFTNNQFQLWTTSTQLKMTINPTETGVQVGHSGLLTDFRVYNGALSMEEIEEISRMAEKVTQTDDILCRCNAGYEMSRGSCSECQIGYYKSTQSYGKCTSCGLDNITGQTGATTYDQCNIFITPT